jgi:hypothetical protein
VPEAGEQATVTPGTLSVATGAGKVTTAEHWVAPASAVTFAGHLMTGGSLSATTTLKKQPAVFPEPSVAVQLTILVPAGKREPEGGAHVTDTPVQLSVAVAAKLTAADACPGSVEVTIGAGHVILGGVLSNTVTENEHVGPLAVVQVTVVMPIAKNVPEGGAQLTAPQAADATGAG